MADGDEALMLFDGVPEPATSSEIKQQVTLLESRIDGLLDRYGTSKASFLSELQALSSEYYSLVKSFDPVCNYIIQSYVDRCLPIRDNKKEWGKLLAQKGCHANWDKDFEASKTTYDSDTTILRVAKGFEKHMVILI